jgi:hypothetical protein
MKDKVSVPDYKVWSKMGIWKFKDAAMLLHNIEPLDYPSVKFNVSLQRIPIELQQAYKTYLILQSNRGEYLFTKDTVGNEAHPFDIMIQAQKKAITVPRELKALMDKRMRNEIEGNNEDLVKAFLPEENLNEEPLPRVKDETFSRL